MKRTILFGLIFFMILAVRIEATTLNLTANCTIDDPRTWRASSGQVINVTGFVGGGSITNDNFGLPNSSVSVADTRQLCMKLVEFPNYKIKIASCSGSAAAMQIKVFNSTDWSDTWTGPSTAITATATKPHYYPSLIHMSNNTTLLIYTEAAAGITGLYTNVSNDYGEAWTPGVNIATYTSTWTNLIENNNSIIIATSVDQDSFTLNGYNSTDFGDSWGANFTIYDNASFNNPPNVAGIIQLDNGTLMQAFTQPNRETASPYHVHGVDYGFVLSNNVNGSGGWGSPHLIKQNAIVSQNQYAGHLSMFSNGTLVFVYLQNKTGDVPTIRKIMALQSNLGSWVGDAEVVTGNNGQGFKASHIYDLGNGDIIIEFACTYGYGAGNEHLWYVKANVTEALTRNWTITDNNETANPDIYNNLPDGVYNFTFANSTDFTNATLTISAAPTGDIPTGITLHLNDSAVNRTLELGEMLNITASINQTGLLVCLSVNHTEKMGENFTCGTSSVTYLWNRTFGSLQTFNDSTTSKEINFSSVANQTFYIKLHSYDLIVNASLNLTGEAVTGENYPEGVKVYINDSLSNFIPGALRTGNITVDELNDSSTSKNLSIYLGPGTIQEWVELPIDANVTEANLSISGFLQDDDTEDSYDYELGVLVPSGFVDEDWTTHSHKGSNFSTFQNYTVTNNLTYANFTWKYALWCINSETWVNMNWSMWVWDQPGGKWVNFWSHYYHHSSCPGTDIVDFTNSTTLSTFYSNDRYTTGGYISIRHDFNFSSNYPARASGRDYEMNMSTYPTATYLDVGANGSSDWTYNDELNTTMGRRNVTGLADAINDFIDTCTEDEYGNCQVPLLFYSGNAGKFQADMINVVYESDPNPVYLNTTQIQDFLDDSDYGWANLTVKVQTNQGNITVDALNFTYNGSSYVNITAFYIGNATYQCSNETLWTRLYYSRFNWSLPYDWTDYILFYPETNSSKNVTPWGQDTDTPIFNITWYTYGNNSNLSMTLNATISCLNISASNSSDFDDWNISRVNTTKQVIYDNIAFNSVNASNIWLQMNMVNCNGTAQAFDVRKFEFESCCKSCMDCW